MTKSSEKPQDFTEAVESAGENSEFDISVRSPSGEVITTYRLVKLSDTMFNVPTVNNLRSIGPPVEFVPTVGEESITWAEGEVLKIKDRKTHKNRYVLARLSHYRLPDLSLNRNNVEYFINITPLFECEFLGAGIG